MTFRLNLEKFKEFRKALLIRSLPMLMLPLIFVLYFNRHDVTTLPFLLVIFFGIISFTMFNTLKRQKRAWETFELTIKDNIITRVQEQYPTIILPFSEVVEAIEIPNGSITIVAKSKANSIVIPYGPDSKDEFVKIISSFTILKKAINKYTLLYTIGAGILGLVLFGLFFTSTDFYVIQLSGFAFAGTLIWSFVQIQRNKNIDRKMKLTSYAFIIPLLSVLLKLIASWK
jgi:hypothetical protein